MSTATSPAPVIAVSGQNAPHHGQAIMIEKLLERDYAPILLVHIR